MVFSPSAPPSSSPPPFPSRPTHLLSPIGRKKWALRENKKLNKMKQNLTHQSRIKQKGK